MERCGNCKYWREHQKQKYSLKMGYCMIEDVVKEKNKNRDDLNDYDFNNIFEDEYYNDDLNCFTEKDSKFKE